MEISLTTLGEPARTIKGKLLERSGSLVRFEASTPPPAEALVKLEWNDTLALGRVTGICRDVAHIELEHLIEDAGSLKRHNRIWWHTEADPEP